MASANQASDIVVVGAGVFGLAVALAALARGRRVLVIDAEHPGAGASGGIVGALSPHVPDQWNPKKAFQLAALEMAPAYWRGLEAETGRPTGFAPVGRIIPLRGAQAVARATERAAEASTNWPEAARWRVIDRQAAAGVLSLAGVDGLIHETLSARLLPHAAVRAMAAAVEMRGGRILTDTRVVSVETGRVDTGAGQITADQIVLAAGVGGFPLLAPLVGATPGQGVKGQAAMMQADLPHDLPVLFDNGLYIINHGISQGRGQVAVGSTSEPAFDAGTATDAKLDDLIELARSTCPPLARAPVLQRWAGVRPKARRRDPMLGAVPGYPSLFVALGGFKIGFGIAPLVGEVLARMMQGEAPELPESFFVAHHL